MATREEIEQQIEQAKADLTSSQSTLTTAMEGAREMAEEEGGRGHEGIASAYLAAMEKLEEASNQTTTALSCAEEGLNFVAQTRGLAAGGSALASTTGPATTPSSEPAGSSRQVTRPAAKNPIHPPNNRHNLNQIRKSSRVRAVNTVVLPGTDVDGDLDAIRNGRAQWDPQTDRYEVNGRRYGVESSGTVFPEDGPGLVQLSRSEYQALKGVIQARGQMDSLPRSFAQNPSISAADWDKAAQVYKHHGTYSQEGKQ